MRGGKTEDEKDPRGAIVGPLVTTYAGSPEIKLTGSRAIAMTRNILDVKRPAELSGELGH